MPQADANNAASPRMKDGFLRRGDQVTRLEAFVDAAFAFAVTLLVISIDAIPSGIDDLLDALKGVPAFAASFAMIAMFWAAHARWSRRFGLDDPTSTILSLALVFLVLIFVYPLKMLFATLFGFITGGWLPYPSGAATGPGDVMTMFIVYALAFTALSLCLLALNLHALRRADALRLDADERSVSRSEIAVWAWFVATGLLSLVLALCLPPTSAWTIAMPGNAYWLLALSGVVGHLAKRGPQSAGSHRPVQ